MAMHSGGRFIKLGPEPTSGAGNAAWMSLDFRAISGKEWTFLKDTCVCFQMHTHRTSLTRPLDDWILSFKKSQSLQVYHNGRKD